MLLRKKYCGFAVYLQIKSLTKIIDQNALEFLALWRDLLGIALQARNLKQNLKKNLLLESFSVSSVCSVDFLGLALRLYSIVLNFEKCMTEIKIIS